MRVVTRAGRQTDAPPEKVVGTRLAIGADRSQWPEWRTSKGDSRTSGIKCSEQDTAHSPEGGDGRAATRSRIGTRKEHNKKKPSVRKKEIAVRVGMTLTRNCHLHLFVIKNCAHELFCC